MWSENGLRLTKCHQLKVEWVEVGETDTPATLGPKVLEVWKRNGYFEI